MEAERQAVARNVVYKLMLIQISNPVLHDCVEMVEAFDGYVQVVLVLEADFGISLFVREGIMALVQL